MGPKCAWSEIRVLRRNPSIGALAESSAEAGHASLRAMIDFRRPEFASLRTQRSSRSASPLAPSTIKSKVPGVGALYKGFWKRVRGGGAAGSGSGTSPAKPEMRATAAVERPVR